jgi:hypothetical protein
VRRNIEPCDRIDCKTSSLGSVNHIFDGLNLFEHRCRNTGSPDSERKKEQQHAEKAGKKRKRCSLREASFRAIWGGQDCSNLNHRGWKRTSSGRTLAARAFLYLG